MINFCDFINTSCLGNFFSYRQLTHNIEAFITMTYYRVRYNHYTLSTEYIQLQRFFITPKFG